MTNEQKELLENWKNRGIPSEDILPTTKVFFKEVVDGLLKAQRAKDAAIILKQRVDHCGDVGCRVCMNLLEVSQQILNQNNQ